MEVDVLMQHDNKLIRTKSDQFMEDRNESNFEQVPNQEPLLVQETYVPIEHANNLLPTSIEPVQSIQLKLLELVQPKLVYIFLKTSASYA